MNHTEILSWLREERAEALADLWRKADDARRDGVGDEVHLRGLIEVSNHCVRQCHYCGLRAGNRDLLRYRMSVEEILDCARAAVRFGYGTVVVQAGEDPGLTGPLVADLVRQIKDELPLAVTLSLGERSLEELATWCNAGADRYLLRFETSNPELFARIHPPRRGEATPVDRIGLLGQLRRLGYEVGSGIMIGIPGQTQADLARDLELFGKLDLDMIGVGPFIAHPATPLAVTQSTDRLTVDEQVPPTELMTYKAVALARLCCPRANIPSTTALATLNLAEGRELGLQRGANILMPNLTPPRYRTQYEIYPAKACIQETAEQCQGCMRRRIDSIGRRVGQGHGAAQSRM